ncbi:MAG TPA: TRAP transporter small permease [Parvularcula sp.]|nr:TRAP transporter small permease [Parvularcula sp.]HBS33134.1 TRAP transporter small permease [Parvularcula sp.]HBS34232.1 TRAP transporter small permease [Parvularcula sp.]
MNFAIGALAAVNTRIAHGGRAIAGGVLAAMLFVIMLQVVSRYIFNSSLSWTEELSKSLMVWSAFLVAPWALRTGANVGVDMFLEAMAPRVRFAVELAVSALVLWILIILFRESLGFVARGLQSRMATLPVTTGYVYMIMPVALGAMMLAGAEVFLRQLRELLTGARDPAAPHRPAPPTGE